MGLSLCYESFPSVALQFYIIMRTDTTFDSSIAASIYKLSYLLSDTLPRKKQHEAEKRLQLEQDRLQMKKEKEREKQKEKKNEKNNFSLGMGMGGGVNSPHGDSIGKVNNSENEADEHKSCI